MRETIGHYRILEKIGGGGIGDVYRARDPRAGRTVAIKIVNAEISRDPVHRQRLVDDARVAAALSHPNIAALYEVGEDDDALYLVSEFVPGDTLKTIVAGRAINSRRAIDLAAQVADALAEAHAQGLVHGDLTADNIIVTPKGSVKVMEPGFAAWFGRLSDMGAGVPDPSSDIAALGGILSEMLTGGYAPAAATALPAGLKPIVNRMLTNDSTERITSAALVAAELRSLAAVMDARNEGTEQGSAVPSEGKRSRWMWVALLIVLAAAALAWMAVRAR
jgi:serine/threonine protein kinase